MAADITGNNPAILAGYVFHGIHQAAMAAARTLCPCASRHVGFFRFLWISFARDRRFDRRQNEICDEFPFLRQIVLAPQHFNTDLVHKAQLLNQSLHHRFDFFKNNDFFQAFDKVEYFLFRQRQGTKFQNR